jgi:hypothetical protein
VVNAVTASDPNAPTLASSFVTPGRQGRVVATATLDQSQARGATSGFTIATDVQLAAAGTLCATLQNRGSGPLIADAVYVFSSRMLYNDGSVASQFTLQSFEAISLPRRSGKSISRREPLR